MSADAIVEDAIAWIAVENGGAGRVYPRQATRLGEWCALVWDVGGLMPWRAQLVHGMDQMRVTSVKDEAAAKRRAEKRLRKAAT